MNAVIYEFPKNRTWQVAYRAAIAEVDATHLADRIAEAKKAIVERARDLFQMAGEHFEEEQALDSAICVLHALNDALNSRSIAIRQTRNNRKTGGMGGENHLANSR